MGHIAANRRSARTKPETTCRGWNSALRSHPFPGKEKGWTVPGCQHHYPLPHQHHPIAWAQCNPLLGEKERKGRGKKEEKKEEVIKQPSRLLLAPPSVTVNPRGHFEWSLPAAGGRAPWVGVTSASGRCTADRAWMVLRSCSSLAISSFWPASVDTASVSWICSSAQRTGKQSRGRHPGVAQTPKFCQGDTEKLRNPHLEHRHQLTGSNPVFSLFLGAAGGTTPTFPALLQAEASRGPAPSAKPRAGSHPQAGPVPRPSAGGNASGQLLAPAQLLQMHQ